MDKSIYYQITKEELSEMRELMNNISLVYLVLKLENPFCDRPIKIDPIKIADEWNIPKSSVYEAILKLKQMGKIKIQKSDMILEWNKTDYSKCPRKSKISESILENQKQSEISESILKNQNPVRNLRINSEKPDFYSGISENQPMKPPQDNDSSSSQTIQTIQTISYSSDRETPLKERENIDLSFKEDCGQGDKVNTETPEDTNQYTQVMSQNNSVNNPVSTQATQHDTFSPDCATLANTQSHKQNNGGLTSIEDCLPNTPSNVSNKLKAWEWMPDGEWKVDHKLDPIFHDWLAKKWMVQYQKSDLFQAKADVLAYFQKTPERLSIRWLQYQEELNARNKHRQQIGITDPTPSNRQSLPSGNQNTVVISNGQRTIKSKDFTGISKQEQIPFNPNLRQRFTEWLNQKTGRTQPI